MSTHEVNTMYIHSMCLYSKYVVGEMLAATSVFQQKALEIRAQRINWQSYLQ